MPRIPLRFFWLADLTVLAVAFLVAHALTPHLQPLVTRRGLLYAPWLEAVIPPGVGGRLPPLLDLVWVYLLIAPLTLVMLAALGNHGPLLERSLSRTVLGSFAAPLVGLALVTLALFALKSQGWSRLFIFSFVLLSGAGLATYRILLFAWIWNTSTTGRCGWTSRSCSVPSGSWSQAPGRKSDRARHA